MNGDGGNRRRFFLEALLAGAAMGAADAAGAEGADHPIGADPERRTGADLGTLYSDVMELANRRGYPLSLLSRDGGDIESYRREVRETVLDLYHYRPEPVDPAPEVEARWETDDYVQERVWFNTTPVFRVPAYVLIPKKFGGPRPAVIDLHCHAGVFVYGKEKVMPVPNEHPFLTDLRERTYGGRSTSAELAKRGYVVISIDRFYFGERRTLFDDMNANGTELSNLSSDQVRELNRRAARGEATLTKALFWAGTTWHGIAHWDDMRTIDYLATRPEVDPQRIGCVGVSMGADRTNHLAALDGRIQCAVTVGWMSTLKPMIKAHIDTHSFSHFLPGLARYMDLPDMVGAMAPKPLMVQQCLQDGLYPLEGMREAADKLERIYQIAGASENYSVKWYGRPHVFDAEMQEDAFDWFDRHLKD